MMSSFHWGNVFLIVIVLFGMLAIAALISFVIWLCIADLDK
jgi:hypothetical protein